jgi:hypothetical protein
MSFEDYVKSIGTEEGLTPSADSSIGGDSIGDDDKQDSKDSLKTASSTASFKKR